MTGGWGNLEPSQNKPFFFFLLIELLGGGGTGVLGAGSGDPGRRGWGWGEVTPSKESLRSQDTQMGSQT